MTEHLEDMEPPEVCITVLWPGFVYHFYKSLSKELIVSFHLLVVSYPCNWLLTSGSKNWWGPKSIDANQCSLGAHCSKSGVSHARTARSVLPHFLQLESVGLKRIRLQDYPFITLSLFQDEKQAEWSYWLRLMWCLSCRLGKNSVLYF